MVMIVVLGFGRVLRDYRPGGCQEAASGRIHPLLLLLSPARIGSHKDSDSMEGLNPGSSLSSAMGRQRCRRASKSTCQIFASGRNPIVSRNLNSAPPQFSPKMVGADFNFRSQPE